MNKRIRKKRIRDMLLLELSIRFDDQDEAVLWLETPLPEFEGRTPRETIAAGEVERVTMLLDEQNTAARAAHRHA
ncbi:MAG: antitoxin Xre/MbcA/ParS toxin-binding domain-containing protein [bacterium]